MAKREPTARPRCDHPVANWVTVGSDARLICRTCANIVHQQFAGESMPTGVLYKGPQGLYGPFSPRGWLQ